MSEIYILNINEIFDEDSYLKLLKLVPIGRREKIERFRYEEDAKRALYASILIRYIIYTKYSENPISIQEGYNTYGKPYIIDKPEWQYNLSHSGEWVVCGFSDRMIGVDVEKIGNGYLDVAKRFYSQEEYVYLSNLEEKDRIREFYKIWTLKESYVKYIGQGLTMPLNSFRFRFDQGTITLDSMDNKKIFFANKSLPNDYILAVCTEEKEEPRYIQVVKEDILQLIY